MHNAIKNVAKCTILELNLKSNPVADRRLLKLIDQCRTKQVLDYVKQHCTKSAVATQVASGKSKSKKGKNKSNDEVENEVNTDYKYSINVKHVDEHFKVSVYIVSYCFHMINSPRIR